MRPQKIEPLPEAIEQLLAAERPVPVETAVSSAKVLSALRAQMAGAPTTAAPSAAGSASDTVASVLARAGASKLFIAVVSFSLGGATVAILQSGRPRDVREPSTNAHRQRTAHQLRGAGRAAEATEPAPVPSSTQAKPLPPGPARHAVDGAPPPLARRRPSRRRHRSQSERLIDSWPKSGRRWRWRAPLWGAGGQKGVAACSGTR